MKRDVLVISSYDFSTFSLSSSFRLKIGDGPATIQRIKNLVEGRPLDETVHRVNWHGAPKLNGITIYHYLADKGYTCELVDTYAQEVQRAETILKKQPAFCIVSTTFISNKAQLRTLTRRIKQLSPDTTIIAGGPFVLSSFKLYNRRQDPDYDTNSPANDFLFLNNENEPSVDYYVVSSQGLHTLVTLMAAVGRGQGGADIPNVGYYMEKGIHFNPIDHDELFEDISINWQKLPGSVFKSGVITAQASNGCPFQCRFCNFVKDSRFTFVRSIDDVVRDMKQLKTLGIDYVRFVDDNFRLGKKDLEQFCRTLIDERVGIKWMSFIRIANLKDIDHELLRQSGCVEVQLGLESADEGILDQMGKKVDPQHYSPIIKSLLDQGINISSTFIIGFPGETEQSARKTVEFLKSVEDGDTEGTFTWALFPFIVLPLSPIYEAAERKRYGLEGYMHKWRHHTMDMATAQRLIAQAYSEIDHISTAFTGDSLPLLNSLTTRQRKQFLITRHRLSQLTQTRALSDEEIVHAFDSFF